MLRDGLVIAGVLVLTGFISYLVNSLKETEDFREQQEERVSKGIEFSLKELKILQLKKNLKEDSYIITRDMINETADKIINGGV